MRQSWFYFSGAGKFCHTHGPRQPISDLKSDVRTINIRSDVTYLPPRKASNDVRRKSLCAVKCKKKRNDECSLNNFNVMGKKK